MVQTVRVEGESMVPTLNNGNLLIADKLSYHFHGPNRGDIVVLVPPVNPDSDYIKRVIGLPGDQIEIDGHYTDALHTTPLTAILIKQGGKGPWQRLEEPYLPEEWTAMSFCCSQNGQESAEPTPYTIPDNSYFVMGDNRNRSSDSRSFGVVARDKIVGRAWIRIFPFNSMGTLPPGPRLVPAPSPSDSPTTDQPTPSPSA